MNKDVEQMIQLLFLVRELASKNNLDDFREAIDECIIHASRDFQQGLPILN
jgi:hypothetical protein